MREKLLPYSIIGVGVLAVVVIAESIKIRLGLAGTEALIVWLSGVAVMGVLCYLAGRLIRRSRAGSTGTHDR